MHETKENLAERIAVFRHGLIARLLPKELTLKQRQHEIRRIVATKHQIPESTRTRVAESTLRDWLRDYRAGGFEALKPKQRIDAGPPRALAVVEQIKP
jgi:putative transposase